MKMGHIVELALLVILVVVLVTHAAGSAADMAIGGSVLNNETRSLEATGSTAGTVGKISYGGNTVSLG